MAEAVLGTVSLTSTSSTENVEITLRPTLGAPATQSDERTWSRRICSQSRVANVTQNDIEAQVPTETEASAELLSLPGTSSSSAELLPSLPGASGSSAEYLPASSGSSEERFTGNSGSSEEHFPISSGSSEERLPGTSSTSAERSSDESSKTDKTAEAAIGAVSLTSTSSTENVEITLRPTPGAPATQSDERVVPCLPFSKEQIFCVISAIVYFVMGSLCFNHFLSEDKKDPEYLFAAIVLLFLFMTFIGMTWSTRIRSESKGANVTQDDIEGQVPTESEALAELPSLPGTSGSSVELPSLPGTSGSSVELPSLPGTSSSSAELPTSLPGTSGSSSELFLLPSDYIAELLPPPSDYLAELLSRPADYLAEYPSSFYCSSVELPPLPSPYCYSVDSRSFSGSPAEHLPYPPVTSGSSSELLSETSGSGETSSEQRSLYTSDSEFASAFVKTAKGAAAAAASDKKEATTAEREATSTVEKRRIWETSEAGQSSGSESGLTSSGEVRRRNVSRQPSAESKRSSGEVMKSSSDEDSKQE